jgi:uncharacterized protein YycO
MITLQFSAQAKPGSWLIRKFSWSDYSHVDFVLPDGTLLGATGSKGVAIRQPDAYSACDRFVVDAPASVLDIAASQIGKPYDWPAILGFVAQHNWQDENAWFCSEFVFWALNQSGVALLRAPKHRITPRDLLLSPYLKPCNTA